MAIKPSSDIVLDVIKAADPVRAQAATWTDSSHNFWMFGGTTSPSGATLQQFNDLWSYNFDSQL